MKTAKEILGLFESDVTKHSNYNKVDYDKLKSKGYSDAEILAIWDRDAEAGRGPVDYSGVDAHNTAMRGSFLSGHKKWDALTEKQKKAVASFLQRNGRNTFYADLIEYLEDTGYLTDAQLAKLPPEAFR